MLDVSSLLEKLKASPYEEIIIHAPHTGLLSFPEKLVPNTRVHGPEGMYKEKPGSLLATIERERNHKPIHSMDKGEVVSVQSDLNGTFIEAGTELMRIRHFLSRKEVETIILKEALNLFRAPEKAKYYFVPSVDIKVKMAGPQSITVQNGMELFIMSRMKRETPLSYTGDEGVIYAVYFSFNQNIDTGEPLIGICPPDQVSQIEDVLLRIQTEWPENE